jgi:hypothetical protein
MTPIILIYLTLGALCSAGFYLTIDYGIRHRGEESDRDSAMNAVETAVAVLPGRMAAALVAVACLWPALVVTVAMGLLKKGRDR